MLPFFPKVLLKLYWLYFYLACLDLCFCLFLFPFLFIQIKPSNDRSACRTSPHSQLFDVPCDEPSVISCSRDAACDSAAAGRSSVFHQCLAELAHTSPSSDIWMWGWDIQNSLTLKGEIGVEITLSVIFYHMKATQACVQDEHMMWLQAGHASKYSQSIRPPSPKL